MKQTVSQLRLGFHDKQRVDVTFDAPDTSSDGGLLLLRQVDEELGLSDWFSWQMPDERDQGRLRHDRKEQVRQRVFQIACGYEDCNDADDLRTDPLLKTVCDMNPDDEGGLSSQPTLSRFENSVTGWHLRQLMNRFEDTYVEGLPEDTTEIILDIDATDDPTHGAQQLSFFHGYYDRYIFLPLMIFDGVSGELVTASLRPGNVHASRGAGVMLERVIRKIKGRFPDATILIRADSGFCMPKDLDRYERLNEELGSVEYIIGIGKNNVLVTLGKSALEEAERRFMDTGRHVRHFTHFDYATKKTWSRKRRIVAKAERTAKGSNPRFVVTTLTEFSDRVVYEGYCQRGQCENLIKDLKNGLMADRLSCHRYTANFFRLLLHCAAYRLMHRLRHHVAAVSPDLGRTQFDTLRLKLLKVAAQVTRSVRRILARLPQSFPQAEVFAAVATRLKLALNDTS